MAASTSVSELNPGEVGTTNDAETFYDDKDELSVTLHGVRIER